MGGGDCAQTGTWLVLQIPEHVAIPITEQYLDHLELLLRMGKVKLFTLVNQLCCCPSQTDAECGQVAQCLEHAAAAAT
jgi:hypothetical protein